jgi:hypothetical protein
MEKAEGGFLKTYIQDGGKNKIFISTICRECSAQDAYRLLYYETMAFELNEDGSKGDWILQVDSGLSEEQAVKSHSGIVCNLTLKHEVKHDRPR